MSYIIRNNKVIGVTAKKYKAQDVLFSSLICKEELDMSREYNLVGAKDAKISNAKKWSRSKDLLHSATAIEINPNEFHLVEN